MSLRFIPSASHPTGTTNLTTKTLSSSYPTAPSAPGLPDTLRSTLSAPLPSSQPTLVSTHPLEARLAHWRSTQQALKLSGLRRTFGIGEPVRRGMELKICREGEWRPQCLGGSAGVHGDILEGRDGILEWEDVFAGEEVIGRESAVQDEIEGKLGMRW